MAKQVEQLETKMADVFVKKAPKISADGIKAITEWAPWIALVAGLFTIWSAIQLWHWSHVANNLVNYANSLCNAYAQSSGACEQINDASRLNGWVWISLIVLTVEGVLYLLAYPGLRDRKKQGWNYVFYAALVNVAFAVVSLFNGYRGFFGFLGALIGSAIGFWLLFQIRGAYKAGGAATPKA
jgi:hypothetical protein